MKYIPPASTISPITPADIYIIALSVVPVGGVIRIVIASSSCLWSIIVTFGV